RLVLSPARRRRHARLSGAAWRLWGVNERPPLDDVDERLTWRRIQRTINSWRSRSRLASARYDNWDDPYKRERKRVNALWLMRTIRGLRWPRSLACSQEPVPRRCRGR